MIKDLVILSSDSDSDLSQCSSILDPRLLSSLTSSYVNNLKQFAELGILLDEYILLNQNSVNLVCMLTTSGLDKSIYKKVLNLKADDFTVYFLDSKHSKGYGPSNGPFCCRPEVFSLLSSAYKINFDNYNFMNTDKNTKELFGAQIVFLSTRLGIKIHVLQD